METVPSRIAQLSTPKEAVGYHEDRYALIYDVTRYHYPILGDQSIGTIIYLIKIIQPQQKLVIERM